MGMSGVWAKTASGPSTIDRSAAKIAFFFVTSFPVVASWDSCSVQSGLLAAYPAIRLLEALPFLALLLGEQRLGLLFTGDPCRNLLPLQIDNGVPGLADRAPVLLVGTIERVQAGLLFADLSEQHALLLGQCAAHGSDLIGLCRRQVERGKRWCVGLHDIRAAIGTRHPGITESRSVTGPVARSHAVAALAVGHPAPIMPVRPGPVAASRAEHAERRKTQHDNQDQPDNDSDDSLAIHVSSCLSSRCVRAPTSLCHASGQGVRSKRSCIAYPSASPVHACRSRFFCSNSSLLISPRA